MIVYFDIPKEVSFGLTKAHVEIKVVSLYGTTGLLFYFTPKGHCMKPLKELCQKDQELALTELFIKTTHSGRTGSCLFMYLFIDQCSVCISNVITANKAEHELLSPDRKCKYHVLLGLYMLA